MSEAEIQKHKDALSGGVFSKILSCSDSDGDAHAWAIEQNFDVMREALLALLADAEARKND